MTDSQQRYQAYMEDRRHNLQMEKYGEMNAQAAQQQARAAQTTATANAAESVSRMEKNYADTEATRTKTKYEWTNAKDPIGYILKMFQRITNSISSGGGANG